MHELIKKSSGICLKCIKNNKSVCLSVFFLLCAFLIGLHDFSYKSFFFFTNVVTLSPTLLSGLASLFIVFPVFLRGKADIVNNHSASIIILLILDICVVATFTSILITSKNLIPGIPLNGYTLLGVGLLLSWVGIKMVAGFVWIILILCSLVRLTSVDHAMGFYGFLYILFSVLGIAFQIKDVCGSEGFLTDYMYKSIGAAGKVVKEDIGRSVEGTKALAGAAMSGGLTLGTVIGGARRPGQYSARVNAEAISQPSDRERRLMEAKSLLEEACLSRKLPRENGMKILNLLEAENTSREQIEQIVQRLRDKLRGHA